MNLSPFSSRRQRRASEDVEETSEDDEADAESLEHIHSEGRAAFLSELAVPAPIERTRTRRDSLEQEQQRLRRLSSGRRRSSGGAGLTELAVPPPVEHRTPPSDEEILSHPSQRRQSLEEKQAERAKTPERPSRSSQFRTELYTVSWLIFFSFLGTLARLGIEAITAYPNAPVTSVVLWANLGGSLIIGFLAEDRRLFREEWGHPEWEKYSFHPAHTQNKDSESIRQKTGTAHAKVKKTIPLYIGLATGFCGSFTSFSSYISDIFLSLANDLPAPSSPSPSPHRHAGYSFLATCAVLIIHPTVSLSALNFGAHLAIGLDPYMPTIPFRLIRRFLDPLFVFVAFGCWLGSIFLSIFPPSRRHFYLPRATLPLVFAPLGCLTRFYLSKHLNSRLPSFPLGTFSANVLATAVLGMAYDLQHTRAIGGGASHYNACAVLQGVIQGFCGCLSTVSTWVAELIGLRRRHAYIYGLTSVAVSLSLLVLEMGGLVWTKGFFKPVCL